MATVPSPRTWAVGELLTAVKLNTDLRDGLNFFLSPPMAILGLTANVTVSSGSDTAISWNLEVLDRDGAHDNSTNPTRWTAQTAGWYELSAHVLFGAATTSSVTFFLNGSGSFSAANIGAADTSRTSSSVSTVQFFNVGGYVVTMTKQISGSSASLFADQTRFNATWRSIA